MSKIRAISPARKAARAGGVLAGVRPSPEKAERARAWPAWSSPVRAHGLPAALAAARGSIGIAACITPARARSGRTRALIGQHCVMSGSQPIFVELAA